MYTVNIIIWIFHSSQALTLFSANPQSIVFNTKLERPTVTLHSSQPKQIHQQSYEVKTNILSSVHFYYTHIIAAAYYLLKLENSTNQEFWVKLF